MQFPYDIHLNLLWPEEVFQTKLFLCTVSSKVYAILFPVFSVLNRDNKVTVLIV